MGWLEKLFQTGLFMPHKHCMATDPELAQHHIIGNALVFGAYFMLPVCMILIALIRKKRFFGRGLWLLFGLFILFCGLGHLFTAFSMSWWPAYRFLAAWHYCTAAISWVTFAVLCWRFDIATRLPTPEQYESLVAMKTEQIERLEWLLKNYGNDKRR